MFAMKQTPRPRRYVCLQNSRGLSSTGGSNPSPSAIFESEFRPVTVSASRDYRGGFVDKESSPSDQETTTGDLRKGRGILLFERIPTFHQVGNHLVMHHAKVLRFGRVERHL